MERLALFISGGGTTATAIINACKPGGELNDLIEPVLVISSSPKAAGIENVLRLGVLKERDVIVRRPRAYTLPAEFGKALKKECNERGVTLFGQYGWLAHTPPNFLAAYRRGINQHPCVLSPGNPDFGGDKMRGRVCHLAILLFRRMTNRDFWTRAVAQRVDPLYDRGVILKQANVDIKPDDDVVALAARVLPVEHRVQIETLKDFAMNAVHEIEGEEIVRPYEMLQWRLACEVAKMAYPRG